MSKKLKSIGATVVVDILLVTLTIYLLFQYAKTGADAVETERADMEISQDIAEMYGYIFRNEEIIYSNGGNSVNYLIENGEKVSKNQIVAQSLQSAADFSAKDQIAALSEKLDILNKSNINLEFVKINIEKIDRDSHAMYLNMLQSIEKGKFKDAGKNKNEFLILLNKRQLITGEIGAGEFENIITAAEDKKKQLETQVSASGAGAVEVTSNKSGIFYYRFDGYENHFTADAAKDLNFETFGELIRKEADYNILSNALGKVAYDFNWYIVCQTQKNKNISFLTGTKYNIIYPFSSNKSVESVLYKQIESAVSDDIVLIFEISEIPFDFDFSRKQTIQVVFNEVSGLKVPEEAIRIREKEDGSEIEGVYVKKGNSVVFRELPPDERLDKFDGYYLYLAPGKRPESGGGTLQLYEDIIVAGMDLYEGKSLD
ncbi:MAG: hypothetical protein FWD23_00465 [Oscillospiraceae bacterium]|nr:hypothetical protein [Oscillospiraceae bacterium]